MAKDSKEFAFTKDEPKEVTKEKKEVVNLVGLERYLQTSPQGRGVCALLRSKYASEAKTTNEWDSIVVQILGKKAK